MEILTWHNNYEVRTDDTLTEASEKQFLEDVLTASPRVMERRRKTSSSSSKSGADSQVKTSTPSRHDDPESYDDDMR